MAAALVGVCVLLYCFGACCWVRRRQQKKKYENQEQKADNDDIINNNNDVPKDEGGKRRKDEEGKPITSEKQHISEQVTIKPIAVGNTNHSFMGQLIDATLEEGTRSPRAFHQAVHPEEAPVEVNIALVKNIGTVNPPPTISNDRSSRMVRLASKRGRPVEDDIESNTSEPVLLRDMSRGTEFINYIRT